MARNIAHFALAGILALLSTAALAINPYDIAIRQRNAAGNVTADVVLPTGAMAGDGVIAWDDLVQSPVALLLGENLAIDDGYLVITGIEAGPEGPQGPQGETGEQGPPGETGAAGQNATTTSNATTSVAGLMSAADKTKVDALTTSNATGSAAGYMSAADKSKLDGAPTVQRTTVTTNASGVATWTFGSAFGSSPVVIGLPVNNTAGESIDVKITSVSTTSVSIQVSKVSTVLGILTLAASPGAHVVHLTAMSP